MKCRGDDDRRGCTLVDPVMIRPMPPRARRHRGRSRGTSRGVQSHPARKGRKPNHGDTEARRNRGESKCALRSPSPRTIIHSPLRVSVSPCLRGEACFLPFFSTRANPVYLSGYSYFCLRDLYSVTIPRLRTGRRSTSPWRAKAVGLLALNAAKTGIRREAPLRASEMRFPAGVTSRGGRQTGAVGKTK